MPELRDDLIKMINATKKLKIPKKPPTNIPRRKESQVLGTLTTFQRLRDEAKDREIEAADQRCRRKWKSNEECGKCSVVSNMQRQGKKRHLDDTFVNRRIEVLTEYNIYDEVTNKKTGTDVQWCKAEVKRVCDGTWAREGKFGPLKTCYKKGEAANVL